MEPDSIGPVAASDEGIDLVAAIELRRRAMEKESGASAARSEVLRRLHELRARERAALQSHGARGLGQAARCSSAVVAGAAQFSAAQRPQDDGARRALTM